MPNWARRRKKGGDQDRDYGVGIGRGSSGAAGGGGGAANPALYGMPNNAYGNARPAAAATQQAAGVGGLQWANNAAAVAQAARQGVALPGAGGLAGLAGNNAALAGQVAANWQGQVQAAWGQAAAANPYAALAAAQAQAQAQARPQAVAQPYMMQGGQRAVPGLMDNMQLMLGRTDGQGGMPGAGQQR